MRTGAGADVSALALEKNYFQLLKAISNHQASARRASGVSP